MRFLIRLPSLSNSLSLASPIIKHDWSPQTCTLREMMKNSAGEVEIVCPHCSRSCLHYDEHECARIATRWLTPDSYWLVIIEGPINQLNRSSWLATFDTSPNMSIVLQSTPFKISWRKFAFAQSCGPSTNIISACEVGVGDFKTIWLHFFLPPIPLMQEFVSAL